MLVGIQTTSMLETDWASFAQRIVVIDLSAPFFDNLAGGAAWQLHNELLKELTISILFFQEFCNELSRGFLQYLKMMMMTEFSKVSFVELTRCFFFLSFFLSKLNLPPFLFIFYLN